MSTTARVLHSAHAGRPIIVIGGGPSAPEQLARVLRGLRGDPVYIFANAHGFKLGLTPDYIVCKDEHHTETKQRMEPLLRAHGPYPIACRYEWADYVMEKWPTQGNSGQLGVGLAALMAGKPIIPVGLDCYQRGTYFHDLAARNVSGGRRDGMWLSSMTRMMLRLEGAVIRSPGGILSNAFRVYDPAEQLPEPVVPKVLADYKMLTVE